MIMAYKLPANPAWSQRGVFSIRDGEQMVRDLWINGIERPDAILCANDLVAAGVLSESRRQGLKVPEDLAIVGFDNTELAHTLGITSVHNPIDAQAHNAFYLLLGRLNHSDNKLEELQYSLVQRETT
jgi:DNA-binding LacI/PurR family transcriptional regulator